MDHVRMGGGVMKNPQWLCIRSARVTSPNNTLLYHFTIRSLFLGFEWCQIRRSDILQIPIDSHAIVVLDIQLMKKFLNFYVYCSWMMLALMGFT